MCYLGLLRSQVDLCKTHFEPGESQSYEVLPPLPPLALELCDGCKHEGLGRVSHLLFCIANGYLLTPEDEFCAIRPCSDETVRKYFSCFSHRSQTSLYGFRQPIVMSYDSTFEL